MKKILLSVVLATICGANAYAQPANGYGNNGYNRPVNYHSQGYRYQNNYYNGGNYYRGGYYGNPNGGCWGSNCGWALAGAALVGGIVGAAIATPTYAAPQQVYVAPQPVYVAPQTVYVAPSYTPTQTVCNGYKTIQYPNGVIVQQPNCYQQ